MSPVGLCCRWSTSISGVLRPLGGVKSEDCGPARGRGGRFGSPGALQRPEVGLNLDFRLPIEGREGLLAPRGAPGRQLPRFPGPWRPDRGQIWPKPAPRAPRGIRMSANGASEGGDRPLEARESADLVLISRCRASSSSSLVRNTSARARASPHTGGSFDVRVREMNVSWLCIGDSDLAHRRTQAGSCSDRSRTRKKVPVCASVARA